MRPFFFQSKTLESHNHALIFVTALSPCTLAPIFLIRGKYLTPSRYSARELSYETNVLPVLSGLAHAFKDVRGIGNLADDDDYLAEIWRDDLSRDLFWTPHEQQSCQQTQSVRSDYMAIGINQRADPFPIWRFGRPIYSEICQCKH